MPWNDGNFELLYDFEKDKAAGRPQSRISAKRVMDQLRDMAKGMAGNLRTDGTNSPSAPINLNGQRITDAANAVNPSDYLPVKQASILGFVGQITQAENPNVWSAKLTLAPEIMPVGYTIMGYVARSIVDGGVTFGLNQFAPAPVTTRKRNALAAGDVVSDTYVSLTWDGERWRSMTPVVSELISGANGTPLANVNLPLTGNGTTTPLDIDFVRMSDSDCQALANSLVSSANAIAALSGSGLTAPPTLTQQEAEPTGEKARFGCLWLREPEIILYIRLRNADGELVWVDISSALGGTASLLGSNAVTNENLSQMPAKTLKGNRSASAANASDLTIRRVALDVAKATESDIAQNASGTYTPDCDAKIVHNIVLTGTVNIQAPINYAINQPITFRIKQDAVGGRSVVWGASYNFGGLPQHAMTSLANATDYVSGVVVEDGKVHITGIVQGY